jgi:1-acyl-sn-glycerol-3-phosphate acyltransferase
VSLHYTASRFVVSTVLGVLTGWKVAGRGQVPRTGGLIVASNHVSFWDPPLVGASLPREIHFLAKEELFRPPLFGALIRSYNAIPIRRGVADLSGMARAIEVLRQGGALLMFPEGSRMRDGELHPARPGVGMLAVNADVPILPVFISGSQHPGKWLYRGARVRVSYGAPRTWRELAGPEVEPVPGRALYQQVGEGVMREIAALKSQQLTTASRGAA